MVAGLRLFDFTLAMPESNLALDEALLRGLERGAAAGADGADLEALRFWESPRPVVVVGRAGRIEEDVLVAACERGRVPVLRRASGGGAVLLGPGCLCYALVLSYRHHPALRDVRASYGIILERVARSLAQPGLAARGQTDLALADRKVSGSAQLRGRFGLLHQGTILHAFDAGLIGRYLREPRRQPAYRARRPHGAFVTNLTLRASEVKARLAEAWGASPSVPDPARQRPRPEAWGRQTSGSKQARAGWQTSGQQ